jgi:preprotein translocase SecE subunit
LVERRSPKPDVEGSSPSGRASLIIIFKSWGILYAKIPLIPCKREDFFCKKNMVNTMKEKPSLKDSLSKWFSEDDAPEIGIATKEPLPQYIRGVKSEFLKISWPSKDQAYNEFIAVVVIVAIITVAIFIIDLGIDRFINFIKGA